MAKLDSLIKLRRHNVDEKQRILAELFRQIERFEIRKRMFEEELKKEREVVDQLRTPEILGYFGRYSQVVRRDLARIDVEVKKLDTRIRAAQDDIREAFASLKRIEIVQKSRKETERKEQNAKETAELDDIAIESFRRNAE